MVTLSSAMSPSPSTPRRRYNKPQGISRRLSPKMAPTDPHRMISNGRVVIIRTRDPSSRNERARIRIGRTFVKAS